MIIAYFLQKRIIAMKEREVKTANELIVAQRSLISSLRVELEAKDRLIAAYKERYEG